MLNFVIPTFYCQLHLEYYHASNLTIFFCQIFTDGTMKGNNDDDKDDGGSDTPTSRLL